MPGMYTTSDQQTRTSMFLFALIRPGDTVIESRRRTCTSTRECQHAGLQWCHSWEWCDWDFCIKNWYRSLNGSLRNWNSNSNLFSPRECVCFFFSIQWSSQTQWQLAALDTRWASSLSSPGLSMDVRYLNFIQGSVTVTECISILAKLGEGGWQKQQKRTHEKPAKINSRQSSAIIDLPCVCAEVVHFGTINRPTQENKGDGKKSFRNSATPLTNADWNRLTWVDWSENKKRN